MAKKSAGLLMYRFKNRVLEIFLAHMGGPFWAKEDEGAWTIPKGEFDDTETPLEAAKREFYEETGIKSEGNFIELTPIKQSGGKYVYAWAFESDCDPETIKSNTFEMEWPPRSGKRVEFPEIDRAAWFSSNIAKQKILKGQRRFIDDVTAILEYDSSIEK